jgi:peptidoglycan/xylan/chitin deacetylase (PgdA/CDA1 family)
MKDFVKAAVCGSYKYSGLMWLQETFTRTLKGAAMSIVVFHRVSDDLPEDDLTVSTWRFDALCRMFRRRFNVVSLAEVFRMVRGREPFPARTLAITFDDGYRDNLFAARTLSRYGLPACFFITTSYVGSAKEFGWDESAQPIPKLTWDEVREMDRLGFEIGSHTHSHADLGRVPVETVRYELAESKRILENELRRRVRWFAFPFGRADCFPAERWPLVQEAGYDGAVSVFGKSIDRDTDPRMLPRYGVPACSPLTLEVELSGCLTWLRALRQRVGWQQSLATTSEGARDRQPQQPEENRLSEPAKF